MRHLKNINSYLTENNSFDELSPVDKAERFCRIFNQGMGITHINSDNNIFLNNNFPKC